MELLSLEEEVVMWMQDLAIKEEEEASDFQEWVKELQMEAARKAQVRKGGPPGRLKLKTL